MRPLELNIADFEHRLMAAMPIAQFKRKYFRLEPLLCDGQSPDHYRHIFKRGDLTEILTDTLLPRPAVRMIGEERVLPMDEICRNVPYGKFSFERITDMGKVRKWYEKGYTLNLRAAHYFHQGLRKTVKILSDIFGCHIRVNIYLTPASKTGLVPHYDLHDVFVIQIAGEKVWHLHEHNIRNPTEPFKFNQEKFDAGEIVQEYSLKPGDLLYIPRGHSHSARAVEESVHLTIGIEEPTTIDLLHSLVSVLEKNPQLRENFECARALRDQEYLGDFVTGLTNQIQNTLDDTSLTNAIRLTLDNNLSRYLDRDASFINAL